MSLILRSAKLDPLTHDELDDNFEFLDDKINDIDVLLTDYVEVPSGVTVGDTVYWDGAQWAVTSTLNADTVTNGVYTTGNQTIGGVKTFTSTISGSIDGTAPRLQIPRTINGTDFDGSTNITTANWGTPRHLTIGGTTKVVNGSANYTWLPAEIHSGLADTATVAERTRHTLTVNGTPWDGSSDLSISTSNYNGSDAVKLSGDQTISGTKTFNSVINGSVSGSAGSAGYANSAGRTSGTLTIDGTAFDGSSNVSITTQNSNTVTLNTNQFINGTKTFLQNAHCQQHWITNLNGYGWYHAQGSGWTMNDASYIRSMGTAGLLQNGPILAVGNIIANYSDERLKEKTGDIIDALDKVGQIDTFLYKNNDLAKEFGYTDDELQIGVSAQSVERVIPQLVTLAPFDHHVTEDEEVVSKSGENYKTVDYARLTALLVAALKEAKQRIEILESKVD